MSLDCILIGFNDEKMETAMKRVTHYKERSASYEHLISRSAIVDGKRLKFSELVNRSISASIGKESDLSVYRMPNMAVHYLSDYLLKRGMNVARVNNFNYDKERLRSLLENEKPLCVGVSTTCQVDPAPIREVVDYIRAHNKHTKIVVGGPYINSIGCEYTSRQQDFLFMKMGADIFVHERQGLKTLLKIVKELRKENPDFSEIPNIIYTDTDRFVRTNNVPENVFIGDDPVREMTFYPNHPRPSVYVQTAISCSLRCAFCRYPILGGEQMFMHLEGIEQNFDYLHSSGVRYLVFIDDSFNIPLDRYKEILKLMIRKKYGFKWFSFFRISHSDEETYELMRDAGCKGVILGVESGNNTILKNMDKQVTVEKLRWGIGQLHKNGIISYASLMIGFPGETEQTALETLNFIREVKPTFYDLQVWFYESAVPIAKEKDYYRLEGYGYSWRHKDMDSLTASKFVLKGVSEITESRFMPSLSFNLWSLGYYLSQGATLEEFFKFTEIFRDLINTEVDDVDDKYRERVQELLHVFEHNEALAANLNMRDLPEYTEKS